MDTNVETRENAVQLVGVCKQYKSFFSTPLPALTNINVTVKRGALYGLLGPSGCGKTTMLRCIVGRLSVDSGKILIFGHVPGTKESGVPGKRIGYMPQELALFNQLTIKETLKYFGQLLEMKDKNVKRRTEFLIHLLKLPEEDYPIGTLSGGQQRRISFACALLHEPDLLILDEPTVGVDPVLRTSIWEHLYDIARTSQTAIIITTHYIEEARQAHSVGLMRAGKVLEEAPPDELVERYEKSTLEDVFIYLCYCDNEAKKAIKKSGATDNQTNENVVSKKKKSRKLTLFTIPRRMRMNAIIYKNGLRLWRNPGFLAFQFLIPIIKIVLFGLAVGNLPHDLTIATVNDDSRFMGKLFLDNLNHDIITQKPYQTSEAALQAVEQGKAWGAIAIRPNFTSAIIERLNESLGIEDATIDQSMIYVNLDMTNYQIATVLRFELIKSYQTFAEKIIVNITPSANPAVADAPIVFKESVYGKAEALMTEFITPGVILTVVYFMEVGITALSFVIERKDGLLDRSWVNGVTATEVMLAHVATEMLQIIALAGLVLVFTIHVFHLPCRGPVEVVIFLVILQGFCGMAFGFVISGICESENAAIMLFLGTFLPNIFLSGIIWPLQAVPLVLQYLGVCLPQTLPVEAVRSVMSRGWGFSSWVVWVSYLITIGWTLFFLISSSVLLHLNK